MKDVVAHLNFDGNCREAMEFYKKCFGAEPYIMTFADVPADLPQQAKEAKNRIVHASLTKGSRVFLMAADTLPGMPLQQGTNFTLNIQCENVEETERLFTALGEKGQVRMPLQQTFFAARFGMLTDQFGINWMLNLEQQKKE